MSIVRIIKHGDVRYKIIAEVYCPDYRRYKPQWCVYALKAGKHKQRFFGCTLSEVPEDKLADVLNEIHGLFKPPSVKELIK